MDFITKVNTKYWALCMVLYAAHIFSAHAETSPGLKGLTSLFVPGSGQAINNDYGTAAVHFSLAAGAYLLSADYQDRPDYLEGDNRFDDDNEIEHINNTTLKADFFSLLATDVALYSSFAAYRDARQHDNSGYSTPAPTESLSDLALAPFQWEHLKKPTTFVPILLMTAALSTIDGNDRDDGFYRQQRAADVDTGELNFYNTVAISTGPAVAEEAFFRGFLNNELSHHYGNRLGLAGSSALFGLAHYGNDGNQAGVLAAGLFGAYLGLLQQKNDFQIGQGVAIHFWNNFLVGLAAIKHGGQARLLDLEFRF